MLFVMIWAVCALAVGIIASKFHRSGIGFFFLSLLLSPLIGLIVLVVIGGGESGAKVCPYCKEKIKEEATICKHCGKEVTVQA